jgi:diadenosine tetraphosphate (Ap4A) HIT family hydrolase
MNNSSSTPAWSLHPQLERDTIVVGDMPLSRVLLNNDANYPWLILVPRRLEIVEIIDLDTPDQMQLMSEIAQTSRALKAVTRCDKLNVAALGNSVPQLHVHVIARFRTDPAGPHPVWGKVPARAYAHAERDRLLQALRSEAVLKVQR